MTNGGRISVEVAGLGHAGLPIPAASRIGPFVATGGIRGVDRRTGMMPEDLPGQVDLMFANLRTIVEAAGASCEQILKLTIWIASGAARAAINEGWLAMFPDEHSRPARHILLYELGGGMLVQCEALAVTL
jgi:2-iminobutanoate/2-iminopropanoate deaminase